MATIIGTLKEAKGSVYIQKGDARVLQAVAGDAIEMDDRVYTGSDASATLQLEGERVIVMGAEERVLIDDAVLAAVDAGTEVGVDALDQALAAGLDLDALEATAAGNELTGDSVQEAPTIERGDARGDVAASLRPTAFSEPEPEFEAPYAAAAAGDLPPETPGNTPPVADDEAFGINVGKYTIAQSGDEAYSVSFGGENGWSGVAMTALLDGVENESVVIHEKEDGRLGVKDADAGNSSALAFIDNIDGDAEAIRFTFDNPLDEAEVSLKNFNTSNSQGEGTDDDAAYWEAYYDGTLVASDTFTGGPHVLLDIDTDGALFDTLVIGAIDDGSVHTNFYVDGISGSGPAPVDYFSVIDNEMLYIPESDLIDGDFDAEGDSLNVIGIDTTGTLGSVTLDGDGNVTYDPAGAFDWLGADESATDSFTYTVSDGNGGTDTATVTVTVVGSSAPTDSSYDAQSGTLDGGGSYDTIVIDSSETPLDFDQLSDIEHIDLQGGENLLSISTDDVLNITSDANILRIDGMSGDAITLSGNWSGPDSVETDYNTYLGDNGVTLHIDADITVDFDVIP